MYFIISLNFLLPLWICFKTKRQISQLLAIESPNQSLEGNFEQSEDFGKRFYETAYNL